MSAANTGFSLMISVALSAIVLAVAAAAGSATAASDPARGKAVFAQWCAPCHSGIPGGRDGKTLRPGSESLLAKYRGAKPAALEERTDLTPELVKYVVRHGIGAMPTTRKTEVSDADLDAVAEYLSRKPS